MEDHDFKTVRKSLNIFSILILLLAYSQAQISELNFLGIKLQVDGPKLYTGIYVVYAYFIWRFLTKLGYRSGFLQAFDLYLTEGDKGIRQEHSLERERKMIVAADQRLGNYSLDELHRLLMGYDINRALYDRDRFLLSLRFSNKNREKSDETIITVQLQITPSKAYIWRKMLRFCLATDKFGDYLFPMIPVLLNIGFVFLSQDWSGSFWSIVGWKRPW